MRSIEFFILCDRRVRYIIGDKKTDQLKNLYKTRTFHALTVEYFFEVCFFDIVFVIYLISITVCNNI